MHRRGRARVALLVAVAALAASLLPAAFVPSAAQAASYRYWSYWLSSGDGWTYSSQGAGSVRPKDGSVQGWRFAVSQGASSSTIAPRTAPSFSSLCQGVEPSAGTRRVGLVIDYGTATDAPAGEKPLATGRYCVRIADGGTGLTVLTAVTSIRAKGGLVCGISGFPKSECTAIVKDAPASAAPPRPTGSTGGSNDASSASGSASGSSTSSGNAEARRSPDASASATAGGSSTTTSATAPAATSAPTVTTPTASSTNGAEVVDATQTAAAGPSGNPLPSVIALMLVVAIAAAAVIARRRRT